MANNTQQFETRGTITPRIENKIVKACGICTSMEHPTNMCPTLQETEFGYLESVGSIGGHQYGKQ
ncbi:hypothetical protein CR513_51594, partial [Mucuna pruriens]